MSRERAAQCMNATRAEALAGSHMTWNDVPLCDRCSAGAPLLEASASRDRSVDGMVPASSAPVASSQDALHPRSGSTFDGFLSQPSGEQRFQASRGEAS